MRNNEFAQKIECRSIGGKTRQNRIEGIFRNIDTRHAVGSNRVGGINLYALKLRIVNDEGFSAELVHRKQRIYAQFALTAELASSVCVEAISFLNMLVNGLRSLHVRKLFQFNTCARQQRHGIFRAKQACRRN